MTDTWKTINSLASNLSSRSQLPIEQQWLVQVVKLQEECGEVAEAAIGALGENPRKGFSHSWDDVRSEACDVIVTGMVLLARMGGDPEWFFREHLRTLAARPTNQPKEA
ncbi:NTP pyrophosphatase (non-canonical NTP hydrolase) [Kitasatospora gansuensis]|uniref:NTP pyrophosphatase (Non-canonical NTP hydrolase) n=1 Tax=Kitasatospora gansuensis TaxID=258050 RepID=A0A7W7SKM1_9ACTN|nr:MazG-like family protein [Kitasatospora gansuensis]MBB4951832.1 NTP pyrophosphatase (non-canonical NTP hydrolase) [Kitasatospora gansuensis]